MTRERKGEWYMVLLAFFESWFPILVIFAYQTIEPLFVYTINVSIASLFFVLMIAHKRKFHEYRHIEGYPDLIKTTIFITLLFLLVFLGLKFTTASNMAVIIFLQLFFSFVYFNLIGSEPIDRAHLLGAFLMGGGAVVILFPREFHLNIGDLMILIAAMIAPIANYYQKRSRQYFSAETILAFRYLASLPLLLFMALLLESTPTWIDIKSALPYLMFSGLLVMGLSKIFWIEAIYLISITKASAMASISPLLTIFFAYLFLNEKPTIIQFIAIIPIIMGGYLITRAVKVK